MSTNSFIGTYIKAQRLSKDEQKALAIKAKFGDKKAKDKLILSTMWLGVIFAKRLVFDSNLLEDCVQQGAFAAIKALDKYDPEQNEASFYSFAGKHIEYEIINYFNKTKHLINLTTTKSKKKIVTNLHRYKKGCSAEPMSKLEIEQMATELNVTEDDIVSIDAYLQGMVYLDSEDSGDIDIGVGSISIDDDDEYDWQLEQITRNLSGLEPRRKHIIQQRWLMNPPIPRDTLGKEMGISGSRVHQLEVEGLNTIREQIRSNM